MATRGDNISSAPAVTARRGRRRRRGRWSKRRLALALTGLALIAVGVGVIAVPLWGVWQRSRADDAALKEWNSGGSQAVAGVAPDSHDTVPTTCSAASLPASEYAKVSFPSLPYGYVQVAGDGTWDLLHDRSMVHYRGSAAPGGEGNDIIAFHREPSFEHIDELQVGGSVDVEDRSCRVWHYHVTARWVEDPGNVTQLGQASGKLLTLITCTPWYSDTQRIVWRAALVGG